MKESEVAEVISNSIIRARPSLRSLPVEKVMSTKISDLALDSLDLTTLSLDVEDACNLVIEPEDFRRCDTLFDLQQLIFKSI